MNYFVQLLGWVLLQVVWQTLAVAALLLVALRWMRGASSALRYRYAALHLGGAIAAVVLTLIVSHASVASGLALASRNMPASGFPSPGHTRLFFQAAAWIWLGGIAVAQALLAVRWIRLRRFLASATPAGQTVVSMVQQMSSEIGLVPSPEVRCARIRSPMVAGRRPTFLLVPQAFDDTFPPAEARALVAHELAHIQQRDYSRNLLHLLAASLLWWHPAAWLIYGRIRHERECSSDEQAVRLTGSAAPLANALFRLAETPATTDPVAIAADSSGLADRITRLAGSHRRPAPKMPAFLAGAAAALAVLIVAASSAASNHEALTRAYAASAVGPPTVFTIHAHDPAGTFRVKMVRGRVMAIDLGEAPVPSAQVVQNGDTVRVVGKGGQELLRFEVDPRGGLRWQARRAS